MTSFASNLSDKFTKTVLGFVLSVESSKSLVSRVSDFTPISFGLLLTLLWCGQRFFDRFSRSLVLGFLRSRVVFLCVRSQ